MAVTFAVDDVKPASSRLPPTESTLEARFGGTLITRSEEAFVQSLDREECVDLSGQYGPTSGQRD